MGELTREEAKELAYELGNYPREPDPESIARYRKKAAECPAKTQNRARGGIGSQPCSVKAWATLTCATSCVVTLWCSMNQAVGLWRPYSVVVDSRMYENWGYAPGKVVWPPTPKDDTESQMSGVTDPDKYRAS